MAQVYRPIDVLEKQVDLVRWWSRSQYRHGMAAQFQGMVDQYITMRDPDTGQPYVVENWIASRLDSAETFYVRSEIISRLWDFTDVYETHEHEVVLPQDLPCPKGFVFLERPIHTMDARGRVVSIKGILWGEESRGVVLLQLSDARDELDEVNRDAYARWGGKENVVAMSEMPPLHITSWTWGRRIANLTPDDFSSPEKLAQFHGNVTPVEVYEENHHTYAHSVSRFNQFVISLWEFVQEQIPWKIPADRRMLKRLQRAHSPLSEVTVVDLRPFDQPYEPTDPEYVPQTVIWNHRWRVREHKRRWIDKNGNYRETTVSAHVKGPEHLPLIEKDRIFHVKR